MSTMKEVLEIILNDKRLVENAMKDILFGENLFVIYQNIIERTEDQKILEFFVFNDFDEESKVAATLKLTSKVKIKKIIQDKNFMFTVRIAAISICDDNKIFEKIVVDQDEDDKVRESAMKKITNNRVIKIVLLNEKFPECIRIIAAEKLNVKYLNILENILKSQKISYKFSSILLIRLKENDKMIKWVIEESNNWHLKYYVVLELLDEDSKEIIEIAKNIYENENIRIKAIYKISSLEVLQQIYERENNYLIKFDISKRIRNLK